MDNQETLDTEFQDSQNPDEELDLDLEDEEEQVVTPPAGEGNRKKRFDEMTPEELLRKVKTYHGIIKSRGNKKPEQPKLKSEDVGETGTRLSKLELLEAKRQFAWENNLSPEETDKVFAITGNKPSKDILKDPFVQSGLEGIRASKRVADATPSPSGRAKKYEGKSFDELSTDEQKQNYSDHVASLLKRK